jgi:hypothetical protein
MNTSRRQHLPPRLRRSLEILHIESDKPARFHGNPAIRTALTPGYETYRGLGWYGVISQLPPTAAALKIAA